MPARQHEPHFS